MVDDPSLRDVQPNQSHDLEEGASFTPRFDSHGNMPAVVTDVSSGELLVVAWMNADALSRTIDTGIVHFYSRSRRKIWKKGEESGNTMHVKDMRTDCDQDVIWLRVTVGGAGAACHTGRRTCFYRAISKSGSGPGADAVSLEDVGGARLFNPNDVYGAKKTDTDSK